MTMFRPLNEYLSDVWPGDLPQWADEGVLDDIGLEPPVIPDADTDPNEPISTSVKFDVELALSLPGLNALELVLAPGGGGTIIPVEIGVSSDVALRIVDVPVALRIDESILTPVRRVVSGDPNEPDQFEPVPDAGPVEITLATLTLDIGLDGDVEFDVASSVTLPSVMIGDTGIVVEATDLTVWLGTDSPTGEPPSWRGVTLDSASLYLPGELAGIVGDLTLSEAKIGNGGFTGTVSTTWSTPLTAELFGIDLSLTSVSLRFVQNALIESSIEGTLVLPFFDEPIDVTLGIGLDGSITVDATSPDGLYRFSKPAFSVEIDALGFEIDDGRFTTIVSGAVAPTIGYDLPPIQVQELEIGSDGTVRLPGGWLDLRDQYTAEVGGFAFEITKFGMGHTDDGQKWVGLNGGIKLLEGIPAGAAVEGLRIVWDEDDPSDFDVSLDGVGVEFEVPETVKFKGEVSFGDDQFRGEIDLELLALDMSIDAEVVFGTTTQDGETFDYMGIGLDVSLPVGIPLWATGLSLYGFGGLFAYKLGPEKEPEQMWFAVSRKPAESWYHEDPQGVTGLKKWQPAADALGFGASVDLATAPDNGLSVATDLTLVMSFPGPIIFLQGRAELLEEGSDVDVDALFQALMVLDNRAGSVTIGVDAHYDNSPLLEISAAAEAFYSFSDPRAWYLNLGRKDPREDRITAEALSIFRAEAYLMLNPDRLATGIWAGYDKSWKFGPLKVAFAAWVSSDVLVNFQPPHFYGNVLFHGDVSLSAFGIGIGLTVDAGVEADVFDPFHLLGTFSVKLNLPWPLPDPKAKVTLEWGPEPTMPDLPDPLEQVGVGHEKLASTWEGELVDEQVVTSQSAIVKPTDPPNGQAPVVPMDARPELTFARPVHDASSVTQNPSPPNPPYEVIGDPAKNEGPVEVRYELSAVNLLAWDRTSSSWVEADDVDGTWAPVPANAGGDTPSGAAETMAQSKLQVWSRTPYHYTRRTGGAWEDTIDRHYPQYPCPAERYCYVFEDLDEEDFVVDPLVTDQERWHRYQRTIHMEAPWLQLFLKDEGDRTPSVQLLDTAGPGEFSRAFVVRESDEAREEPHEDPYPYRLQIYLPQQLRSVRLRLRSEKYPAQGIVRAYDRRDREQANKEWSMDAGRDRTIVFTKADAEFLNLELDFDGSIAILEVCSAKLDLAAVGASFEAGVEETRSQLARWADEGDVLAPYTDYRLEIVTTAHARGRGEFEGHEETSVRAEYVAFRTEGPPGLSTPDLPSGSGDPSTGNAKTETGLETLARYVHQTTPETVPAEGELPLLPRPVYRADPVGVDFGSDYVDLLYRLAKRDLALYVYDANDRPVRDARGRLVVEENQWGKTEDLLLDRATRRWFARLEVSPCIDLDDYVVERTKRLATGDDRVLEPDAVHEARLRPLLYRETWDNVSTEWATVNDGPTAGQWAVDGHDEVRGSDASWLIDGRVHFVDGSFIGDLEPHRDTITFSWSDRSEAFDIVGVTLSTNEVTLDREPGHLFGATYEVPTRYELRQVATVGTPTGDDGTFYAVTQNTDLPSNHADQPTNWSDVRVSVPISAENDDGVVGVVVRRRGGMYYRVELDASDTCRLHRTESNSIARTWSGTVDYRPGLDTVVTVEALGHDVHVLVDGESVLRVSDPEGPDAGTIGLYSRATVGFRCGAVRVDDFRDGSPIAYRYSFTTSQFVDAVHQAHSYDDETWVGPLATTDRPAAIDLADPASRPTPEEHRTYRRVAAAFGAAGQLPERLEVTRLADGSTTTGLFLQSPEPIDWTTTSLTVERGPRFDTLPIKPASLKLTGYDFDSATLSILQRETTDLDGEVIEYRRATEGGFAPTPLGTLFAESFDEASSLDAFDVVDPAGDASWEVNSGEVPVNSLTDWSAALWRGAPITTDVVSATFRVDSGSQAGLVFRHRGGAEHYRLVVDESQTQLLRFTGGTMSVLGTSPYAITPDEASTLRLEATNGQLTASIDDVPTLVVTDPMPASNGRVGVSVEGKAVIEEFAVDEQAAESVLLDTPFETPDPARWTFVKEPPFSIRTPDWRFEAGELRQRSNIYGFVGNRYRQPGTYGVTGDAAWTDYRTIVQLRSDDNDAIGVIVRYNDDNYYRFSMDAERGYRRFVRQSEGETTLLWEDSTSFQAGRSYVVTIDCVGDRLVGYIDGVQLFDVTDDAISAGKVGLYCRANLGARFESLRVVAPADAWVPYHTFDEEVRTSAGTRFEIVDAGPVPTVEPPRRAHRIRNGPPVSLPSSSVHFRVRPTITPAHSRQFRHQDSYDPLVDGSVLRSADGTGVFVFDAADLAEGQYRLRLTPSGDGQFDVPVTLDVPWDRE